MLPCDVTSNATLCYSKTNDDSYQFRFAKLKLQVAFSIAITVCEKIAKLGDAFSKSSSIYTCTVYAWKIIFLRKC